MRCAAAHEQEAVCLLSVPFAAMRQTSFLHLQKHHAPQEYIIPAKPEHHLPRQRQSWRI
jgi:hypothetical protein